MKRNFSRITMMSLSLLLAVGIVLSAYTAPVSKAVDEDAKPVTDGKIDKDPEEDPSPAGDPKTDSALAGAIAGVHQLVKKHWPHMDKVWPGYDYKNHNMLIVDFDEMMEVREAWVLNVDTMRKLTVQEYQNLQLPQVGGYAELKFEGKPSIAMGVDSNDLESGSEAEIYTVATHELVHFYYQGEAKFGIETSRAQSYPIDPAPRLYRQMLFQRLIDAYDHPEQEAEYLAKAKYWLEKYKSEFVEEYQAIRSTDIIESTARYSENLANVIGDDLDEKAFVEAMQPMILRDSIFESADGESYEIGFLAGLILDRQGVDWKKDFYKADKGVEELLLEKVEAQAEEPDETFASKLKAKIEQSNQENESHLASIIKAKDDKSIAFLKLDVSESMASFGATGAIFFDDKEVMTGYQCSYLVGDQRIDLNGISVIQDMEGYNLYLIIPLDMEYSLEGNVLRVDSAQLKADGIKVEQSQQDGRTILLVKVTE